MYCKIKKRYYDLYLMLIYIIWREPFTPHYDITSVYRVIVRVSPGIRRVFVIEAGDGARITGRVAKLIHVQAE